jgi:tRNA uridine 5-carboxymethylaminomethyl modification enzyme
MVQSLEGFEQAKIIRPAYAIEYDYFLPIQLFPTLESRIIENLYFTGQINGTSGYEEAGCQGLVAGINAAQKILGKEPFVLGRETSYTGVLIDDLITKGTEEPYRMFTSRAEHRMLLRQDNADERLMPLAFKIGLINEEIFGRRQRVWEKKSRLKTILEDFRIKPENWKNKDCPFKQQLPAIDLLKRPEINIDDILSCMENEGNFFTEEEKTGVAAEIKYEGFIRRQLNDIERFKREENTKIPENTDYDLIDGLLSESRAKLKKIRPLTLAQASRISGVTPADVSILIMHIVSKHTPS